MRRHLLLLTICLFALVASGAPRVSLCAAGSNAGLALSAPPAQEDSQKEGSADEQAEKAERRELFLKTINFLILVGGLAYVLRKPLAAFFKDRSLKIARDLYEGRKALKEAQAALAEVERKLQHLGEEIAAFQSSNAREMESEHERMRRSSEEEAAKIMEAARSQLDAASRSSVLELKTYAAKQALVLAEEMVRQRLDSATRERLVERFVEGVERLN
jgi:F-type H+-transporting ATPase subunit b